MGIAKVLDTTDLGTCNSHASSALHQDRKRGLDTHEKALFIANAFFLWEYRERILQDKRMCYCPLHIGNNLAFVHAKGIASTTLGGYLTWWKEFDRACRIDKQNRRAFIYFIAGSPLSGRNHCAEVYETGKTKTISVSPFYDYWTSFAEVQERFADDNEQAQAYSLEEVVNILKYEDENTKIVITKPLLKQKHTEYNQLYFDGKLKKAVFKFTNYKGTYGMCSFGARDGKKPTVIWINKHLCYNANQLKDTLIHEMIHQYEREALHCLKHRLFTHGWRFRYMCWKLKRKYGLRISKPTYWL